MKSNIANTTPNENALITIDATASALNKARQDLRSRLSEMESEIAGIQRRHVPGIRKAAGVVAAIAGDLRNEIDNARHLFVRPKTMTLHGITCGLRKGAGKLDWEEDEHVVRLIRKHLPEQADLLIITQEKPSADALKNLDAKDLARIGVTMEGTGDVVVVKAADSAVDKLVAAILKEGAHVKEDDK